MFNLFKKELTAEQFAHQIWLYCCDISENFCGNFGPRLEAAGFIKGANTHTVFADETMKFHLWIISRALDADRDVLDALHNHLWTSGVNSINLNDRYALYDRENSRDIELIRKGLTATGVAEAFLQCVGNKKAEADLLVEKVEISCTIGNAIKAVKEKRSSVKIRKARR